ncbi:hypothetical protein [Hirschia baltica]|uniref:Uncharacterized protein n=1 Tax=Hirschia baltica (strain ATCC 49814 / DSM 5838 / IFAM 1418) TaxID=582402 RepID=C6XM48_HIRBI|nr:hypothetical protein [Hirschia baltica]ACT59880.1 hypothetical protein Hbal_2200 [Hirschia baltica ATCC 49814]
MKKTLGLFGISLILSTPALADTTIRSNWSAANKLETSIVNAAGTPDKPNKDFKPRAFVTELCYDRGEADHVTIHIDGKSASSVLAKNACIILQGQYDIIVETDKAYAADAAPSGHLQFILPSPVATQKTTKTITRRLLEKTKPSED